MIGEAVLDGVFVPFLLLLTVGAFLAFLPIRWLLRRMRFYRFVWHAGLFDTALYVVILWIVAAGTMRLGAGGTG